MCNILLVRLLCVYYVQYIASKIVMRVFMCSLLLVRLLCVYYVQFIVSKIVMRVLCAVYC